MFPDAFSCTGPFYCQKYSPLFMHLKFSIISSIFISKIMCFQVSQLITFVPQLDQGLIHIIVLTKICCNYLYPILPTTHMSSMRLGIHTYHIVIHNGSCNCPEFRNSDVGKRKRYNHTYLTSLDLHFSCLKWSP